MSDKDNDSQLNGQTEFTRKENIWMVAKYWLIAISAGIIQLCAFTVLTELNVFRDSGQDYGWSYFIALVISVLWNFTVNRRYTFRSANNVPKAMAMVFCYYLVFTPLSILWGIALTDGAEHWVKYAVLIGTMLINGVTEFLFLRFVVFRRTINTNKAALKLREDTERKKD